MFYDVYERLCVSKNESPWNLPVKLGLLKSNSAVAQWKNGSVPRHKTLQALADYFDVSVSYLMDLEQKEKPLANNEELSPIKKEAIELIKGLPQEELERFVRFLRTYYEG